MSMVSVSQKLKRCGVKITAHISGAPSYGSGVLYSNPIYSAYDYVLTAKHIFQEDSHTPYDSEEVFHVEIAYSEDGVLKRLDYLNNKDVKERLIIFDEDFAILIIKKNKELTFPKILVSDELNESVNFFSWGIFSANSDQLQNFPLKISDHEMKRLRTEGNLNSKYLNGWSGAGVFHDEHPILYGIVSAYPNEAFQNGTIDCTSVNFPKNQTV